MAQMLNIGKKFEHFSSLEYQKYKRVFRITSCFSSILELSVRGESNEFHIFNFVLQQIIVSKLTVHVHPPPYS